MLASNQTVAAGVAYAAEAVAESQIVYGDANGDGKVSMSDAVAILQYIANKDKYPLSAQLRLNADCVDHGDGITGMDAMAIKLIDAKMLSLEELPVTSQRIQECLNPLSDEEKALLFDEVYTFGIYNTETKTIDIEWLVNQTVNEVEILESADDKEYVSVAKVKDEAKYSYEVKEEFETKYFKVAYTDKYGKLHESFPFFITLKDGKYVTDFFDSDEDGVVDMFESAYGCKIDDSDSDDDGLSDYEEINITLTDPTVRDSFKKGVSDADADCDEDGIGNLSEMKSGTDPLRKDTDSDGLNDLEETIDLKTDPLKTDTDEDGLSDYAEHRMGLDPLKSETNGAPDAEAVIQQKIGADSYVLEAVNADADNKAYKLSVDIKTAGFAEDIVSASKSRYTAVIDEEAVIGDIVDIAVADGTEPESTSISFTVDDEYKDNTVGTYKGLEGIKRLTVFQYNEDIHMLIPMDTEYSEPDGVVSAEIDGTGTYCILDSEQWFDSLGIKPEEEAQEAPANETLAMSSVADAVIGDAVTLKRNEPFTVYFLLQSSGKNGEENFNYQKKMIHDVANYLFRFYDGAQFFVIPYADETNKCPGGVFGMCDDLVKLDKVLDGFEYYTELEYADRCVAYDLASSLLPASSSANNSSYKRIVINLMNDTTIYSNFQGEYSRLCDKIAYKSALFGQVYCGKHPNLSCDMCSYRDPSDKSGLKTFTVKGLDAEFDTEKNYDDVLGFISRCVITYNNYEAPADVSNIYAKLMGELSPDSDMDSDGDGIRDWDELDQNCVIVNPDGTFSFLVLDELLKKANIRIGKNGKNIPSQWEDTSYGSKLEEHNKTKTVAVWKSDPSKKDSDFDDIPDVDDNAPFDSIDDHFMVVEDYSKVTYRELLSREYEEKLIEIFEAAPTLGISARALNPITWKDYAAATLFGVGGLLPWSSPITYKSYDSIVDFVNAYGSMPNASLAMLHYIDGKGIDLFFPDYPFALALTYAGRNRYYYNMNAFFKMVEKNAMIDHTYNFSTVKDINKPGDFDSKGLANSTAWQSNYHDSAAYNINATMDWWYTFGGAQNAMSSSVYCHRNDNGETVYTAKIKYYILDVYDWSKTDEEGLYKLHLAGVAKSYLDYGVYETEIEWVKGSRFPKESLNPSLCDQVEFEGITDPNFEKNKAAAELFYLMV